MSTTKTILLVEDDRRLASHWRWILEGVGYCVIHVSTVDAAIEVLESTQIDLLLTDILIEDNGRDRCGSRWIGNRIVRCIESQSAAGNHRN